MISKLKNKIPKVFTSDKLEHIISEKVDDALTAFRQAREGFDDPLSRESSSSITKEQLFNSFFDKKKIDNKDVRNLLMSALDNVPEVDLSFEELYMIQDACWIKYGTDSLIQGVVDNYVDYIIGSGVSIDTPVPEVTQFLNEFRSFNNFSDKEKEIVKNTFIDGEYFVLLFTNPKGETLIRKAHPRTIERMETAPFDSEVIYSYYQRFYQLDDQSNPTTNFKARYLLDVNYEKMINSGFNYQPGKHYKDAVSYIKCMHIKLNDSDKLRGLPPLKRILKWTKVYENFILDRMVLNHERAKVVWIKTIMQRTKDALNRVFRAPEGGSMLIEKDGIKYRTEKPNLDSSEAKEDAINLLYYIGSGIRYPLHILNQRTDQQVYASIKKADTPFVKMIESGQLFYASRFEKIYRYALEQAVNKRLLKSEYTYDAYSEESVVLAIKTSTEMILENSNIEDIKNEVKKILDVNKSTIKVKTVDIPISQDFQQVLWQDPKEMAEVLKIHKEIGLASTATLSGKAGYKWKAEYPKIMAETKVNMEIEKTRSDIQNPEPTKNPIKDKKKDETKSK